MNQEEFNYWGGDTAGKLLQMAGRYNYSPKRVGRALLYGW